MRNFEREILEDLRDKIVDESLYMALETVRAVIKLHTPMSLESALISRDIEAALEALEVDGLRGRTDVLANVKASQRTSSVKAEAAQKGEQE